MWNCPECGSNNIEDATVSPYEGSDGQGYEHWIEYEYYCEDCGCEFTEREETKRIITVTKHGKEYVK